jgi:hypothetical protein
MTDPAPAVVEAAIESRLRIFTRLQDKSRAHNELEEALARFSTLKMSRAYRRTLELARRLRLTKP